MKNKYKTPTTEDQVRYEIINEGYALFHSLKIRIEEQRSKDFNYTQSVINLIKEHESESNKSKIITPISDQCYSYLISVVKPLGLL